ncbi:hypothetical protein JHK82_039847 [Glycine max]|nr:hypothetical protein JHK82_039847 [Glycine max]
MAKLKITSGARHKVHGTQNALQEDLELERQLELLNKPPIKSIHTNFGYIVDCIDINKQPAFDHPLLKYHKLQVCIHDFDDVKEESNKAATNDKHLLQE